MVRKLPASPTGGGQFFCLTGTHTRFRRQAPDHVLVERFRVQLRGFPFHPRPHECSPNSQALALKDNWQQATDSIFDKNYTLMVEGVAIQTRATYLQTRAPVIATGRTLDIGRATIFKTPS